MYNVEHFKGVTLAELSDNARAIRQNSCPVNICPTQTRLEERSNFFSNRVINKGSPLPSDIKLAPTISSFKTRCNKPHLGNN